MSVLVAGAVGREMDVAVEADGRCIILTLELPAALVFLAQVEHAIVAMSEWRPPQSLADVLGL